MIPAPFKCAGGKGKLVDRLQAYLPAEFVGYCEPFLGGGALFRSLASTGRLDSVPIFLSDASLGTARTWLDIQRNSVLVEDKLLTYEQIYGSHPDDDARSRHYYAERSTWNSGAITGARHIFLRQLAFNGLWRENKLGRFNVPWGRYKRFSAPHVRALARVLPPDVEIEHCSFTEVFPRIDAGWLIYVDPPYLGEFSAYTGRGFTEADHTQLLQHCADAKRRGVHVVYSNRYSTETVQFVQRHWPEAEVHRAVQPQTIAAKSTARGAVEELIAV